MNKKFETDFYAATGRSFSFVKDIKSCFANMLFWGRIEESSNSSFLRKISHMICSRLMRKRGIEMKFNGNIGGGLVFAHGYNITINGRVKIGQNAVLFKGCTIGSVRSGAREGVPQIGDRVVVGCNAFVCGGITVGDDVLIASNAFVNFDVPSNSVVIGNPGVVHHKNNPCKDYVRKECYEIV